MLGLSTLIVALCWHAAGPPPALRRHHAAKMGAIDVVTSSLAYEQVVDLFPDPPSVAGVVIRAPESKFPSVLEQPAEIARSLSSPTATFSEVFLAPLEPADLAAAVFVGLALQLGPDFLLAPAGLVSERGIRPGYYLEAALGAAVNPQARDVRILAERPGSCTDALRRVTGSRAWGGNP